MKRIMILFLALLCSGCTVLNTWTIKADGKDIKGSYQVAGGEAGKANFEFYRLLLISTYRIDVETLKQIQQEIKK